MADAWLQEKLDYRSIAEMVSKIRGKANSLKSGLSLPDSEENQMASVRLASVSTTRQFRERLLLLDKTIMGFITNPVFQAANTLDVNLAKSASRDLDLVLSLSDDLKKNAQKLQKIIH